MACRIRPYQRYFIKITEILAGMLTFWTSKSLNNNLDISILKTCLSNKHKSKILIKMRLLKVFFSKYGLMETASKSIGTMKHEMNKSI